MTSIRWVLVGALLVAGCGDDDGAMPLDSGSTPLDSGSVSSDGGTMPADAGVVSCTEPARSCPRDPPLAGGPCEGALMCGYDGAGNPGGTEWTFQCDAGVWTEMLLCLGCAPQLAERCRPPFAGTLSGVTVEVGPMGGAFRPYTTGDHILPVFGAQGLTMVQFRVRLVGAGLPDCVQVSSDVSLDGEPSPNVYMPVKLRCGESLGVLAILASNPCLMQDYTVDLTVTVDGIGMTTVPGLVLTGGGCPRGG